MRAVDSAAATALAGQVVPMALLVQLDLTATLRLCTGSLQLVYGGHTWTAVGGLGNVGAAQESAGTPASISLQLSGVPASQVSLALSEPVQGKACTLRVAVLDPSTYAVLDAPTEWVGTLDTMTLSEEAGTAVINLTAEHAGVDLLRAVPVRYTDADQQRLYTGDLGFEFAVDTAGKTITWPAASYFRR